MINLNMEIDTSELTGFKGFNKSIATLIGVTAAGFIKERTQLEKVDVNGRRFLPYSPRYRKWRENNSLNGSPVDLTVTGHMVGSVDVLSAQANKTDMEVIVGPSASSKPTKRSRVKKGTAKSGKSRPTNQEIAYYLATAKKPRQFVGLRREDLDKIAMALGHLFAAGITSKSALKKSIRK